MSLSLYYENIIKEPLLSKEEEKDLFLEYMDEGISDKRRDEIRTRILKANLRFVFKLAKGFSKNDPNTFEELIAAGNEGLVAGLEKFDPNSGNRFLTYAGWWVRQRILKHMSSQRMVALPIWRQQLSARIQKVLSSNENITLGELKTHFPEASDKDLSELYQTRFLTFYIEDMEEESPFEINPIEDEVEKDLDNKKIHEVVEELPYPKNRIIQMTFGLLDGEERRPTEIMEELSLTKEEFKTHKKEALAMIRQEFGETSPFV